MFAVDDHGELVAALTMDGAARDTQLNAERKAYTAARSDQATTRELAEKVRDDPAELASFDPRFCFFAGGVAAFSGGRRVGAVGVSGLAGGEDERLAGARRSAPPGSARAAPDRASRHSVLAPPGPSAGFEGSAAIRTRVKRECDDSALRSIRQPVDEAQRLPVVVDRAALVVDEARVEAGLLHRVEVRSVSSFDRLLRPGDPEAVGRRERRLQPRQPLEQLVAPRREEDDDLGARLRAELLRSGVPE